MASPPGFGKGPSRGGARHFSKPWVDTGLVYQVLDENIEVLKDLGPYEHCSKNNSPDAKGLVATLPLWTGLLRLESSGEIHTQPLRTALISLLVECPSLNTGRHSGQVWANLKMERITTILFHVRKLGREKGSMAAAAAKLSRSELEALQRGLHLLNALEKAQALNKSALEKAQAFNKSALEKAEALEKAKQKENNSTALVPAESGQKRKLKKHESDVSMDSKGYPTMFDSPAEEKKNQTPAPERIVF